jgi:protein TonB
LKKGHARPRAWSPSIIASIVVHGALFGGIGYYVATDRPQLRGGDGLAGAAHTRFDVTMASDSSEKTAEKPPTLVREGLEVPRPRTLPTEVKNPQPKEIDENPNAAAAARAEKSDGSSAEAPAGREGQGGSGSERSDAVGNSDRSNRRGLYLEKLHRQIQARLEQPGFLPQTRQTTLSLKLLRTGAVAEIAVLRSSGDSHLDRKAIRAVEKAQPFDPWDNEQIIQVPVIFRAN